MAGAIKGILFDLGDTLLDFGKVDIRAMFESGARQAYDYLGSLGKQLPTFARYHRRQLWAIRWSYFKTHFTRREFNALDVIGRQSLRMEHELTPQQTLELAWRWYEPLSRCATHEAGLAELLVKLRDSGLRLGLVSNTFLPAEVLDRHLRQAGLLEPLEVRVYSCQVGYRKPRGAIFSLALDRAGLSAQETLFVGDSLKADIEGANRAGMISVLKDPAGKHDQSATQPRHRIRRLAELEGILAGYRQP